MCSPFSFASCSTIGDSFLTELVLHFLLQFVDLRLRVLLEALGVLRSASRFPSRAATRAASFITLPLVCSFCWLPCSSFALSRVLGLLLLDQRVDARDRGAGRRPTPETRPAD